MEHNFKVGQRYKVDENYHLMNERGNIIEITGVTIAPNSPVIIEYKSILTGRCDWFHEHSNYANVLKLIPNEKIVITTDGTTTTAKMYDGKQVVKTATAKCNPDDEFDFKKGAAIAFDRLVEKEPEKPKFKVGDFVKVKSCTFGIHYFPIGTIVEIKHIYNKNTLVCYGYCKHSRFDTQYISVDDVEVIE